MGKVCNLFWSSEINHCLLHQWQINGTASANKNTLTRCNHPFFFFGPTAQDRCPAGDRAKYEPAEMVSCRQVEMHSSHAARAPAPVCVCLALMNFLTDPCSTLRSRSCRTHPKQKSESAAVCCAAVRFCYSADGKLRQCGCKTGTRTVRY